VTTSVNQHGLMPNSTSSTLIISCDKSVWVHAWS